ncbi:MAG TPA: YfiR family protein [Azospira sp.]|nr:YfiR family protein [Azospira sp.]
MPLRRLFRSLVCLLALLPAAAGAAFAQQAVPEHELKAAFIYNFIQFTQWPKGGDGAAVNVCANRDSVLFAALQAIAGKLANGRPIVLQALPEARPEMCHVLVATEPDRAQMAALMQAIGAAPVLTVTDDAELIRHGLMIGMVVDAGRMAFIVDNTRASRVGLSISSRLLRLARSVQ